MKRIDTTTLKPYYVEDNDAQIAKVGHVNAVIRAINNEPSLTAIDPVASSNGVPVSTELKLDELTTVVKGGTTYQGHKLLVEAQLNDPSSSVYDLFLGYFKLAPGSSIQLAGVKGSVLTDITFFSPITVTSVFSNGASVQDSSGPGLLQLDFADIELIQNPFDATEYMVRLYAESFGGDFQTVVTAEVELLITAGASFIYSQEL